jgi:hypothetical protein
MKGDGETHPSLSPSDEFANFERWDKAASGRAEDARHVAREYTREALKRGLAYEQSLGVNPFKFGLIGSTTHTPACQPRRRTTSSGRPPCSNRPPTRFASTK